MTRSLGLGALSSRIVVFAFLLLIDISALSQPSFSQNSLTRFEFGTQYSALQTDAFLVKGCPRCPYYHRGPGVTAAYNFTQTWALDSAVFASTNPQDSVTAAGHVAVAQAGVRARVNGDRFAFFAKARPGVVTWSRAYKDVRSLGIIDGVNHLDTVYGWKTCFAVDVGGGFEIFLGPRTAIRTEIGDTLIHSTKLVVDPGVHHNLQFSTGVFFRSGNPLPESSKAETQSTHRFFDKTNVVLHALALSGIAADGIQTQRHISDWCSPDVYAPRRTACRAWYEADPLARPLVKYGWSGQAALAGITAGSELFISHRLHRMGHHRAERIVPIALAVGGGYMAYRWTKPHRPFPAGN